MLVYDTETTGLVKPVATPLDEQPQIIEFAAIKLDQDTLEEQDRIEFLCHPGKKLPEEIVKITHITDEMLKGKPPFSAFYRRLCGFFLGEEELVAHNLEFDRSLLSFELLRLGKLTAFPWPPKHTCTVEAAMSIKGRRLHLRELHAMATGAEHKDQHRAMADVEGLVAVVKWLRKQGLL